MGYSWHPMENLGPPFLLVDESVFVIPKNGAMRIGRSHFKLLFILDGSIEHEIEGVEGRRVLETGDILVAPVVRSHTYYNANATKAESVHLVRLFLDGDHLVKQSRKRMRKPEMNLSDYVLHHFSKVMQLTGGIDSEITALLSSLREEVEGKLPGYRHKVRSICTDLIVAVSRRIGENKKEAGELMGQTYSNIVVSAKEFILKNLPNQITLGEIAWHVGKGEEHLARVFKRETGKSVFDYVREARINRARTLILDPSLSLTEIAERCGFQSLSFFSRTFRQLVGMSPTAYRTHMQAVLSPHRPVLIKS